MTLTDKYKRSINAQNLSTNDLAFIFMVAAVKNIYIIEFVVLEKTHGNMFSIRSIPYGKKFR